MQTELLSYLLPAFLEQRLAQIDIIMRMSPVELNRNQHHAREFPSTLFSLPSKDSGHRSQGTDYR